MKKLLLILLCLPLIGFGQNLSIGDTFQGGIIFYLNGNGGGLIAAPSDQSAGAEWGCDGTIITGADGTAIGTGAQNTIDIEAGCTASGTAADICANLTLGGYSDWFLPSKDELNEMYLNKNTITIGTYSSSSEETNFIAVFQDFFDGGQYQDGKENLFSVRAVRDFSLEFGCIDPTALNYDSLADTDDGSCIATIYGCIDSLAYNYDFNANTDDGSCLYCSYMQDDIISDVYPTPVSCNGGDDGSIYGIDLGSVILNNGNGPYTYSIDSGLTFQSSTIFSNLTAGDYYVTYMDVNECVNPNSEQYWMQIIEPLPYQYTVNMDTVSCQGANDGSITLSISGNTSTYIVNWDNGMQGTNLNSLVDKILANFAAKQIEDAEVNLLSQVSIAALDPTAFNYDPLATVYDNSCLYCDYFSNSLPFLDGAKENVTCNGGSDASIINLAIDPSLYSTGYPPFQFSIDAGNSFLDTNTAYNLSAGTYHFILIDANGCIHPDTLAIYWEVTEPDSFVYNVTESDVSCSGGNDGSINLNVVSGNTSPYSIDWSSGTIGNNNNNLSNGTYQAYVSDANGCQDTLTYFISHPLPITSVINTNDVSCVGGTDGSASISSSGGASPFTYLWSDGQIGNTATNLSEGSYQVFVTDSANCLDTSYFSIGSNPINTSISTTNVTCNGNDGAADASVSGGAAPYSYIWYFEYPGFGYIYCLFSRGYFKCS